MIDLRSLKKVGYVEILSINDLYFMSMLHVSHVLSLLFGLVSNSFVLRFEKFMFTIDMFGYFFSVILNNFLINLVSGLDGLLVKLFGPMIDVTKQLVVASL